LSDIRTRIEALRRKAGDPACAGPEREALLAKATELEEKYPDQSKPHFSGIKYLSRNEFVVWFNVPTSSERYRNAGGFDVDDITDSYGWQQE
jgi:hypothetical protein